MAIYEFGQGPTKDPSRNETPEQYEAFRLWLHLGRNRALKPVADATGVSMGVLKTWSSMFCWPARAAAYAADRVEERFKEVEEEKDEAHRAAIAAFRQKQEERAFQMGELADVMMLVTKEKLETMRGQGRVVKDEVIASLARTVTSLVETAANLQATALGIDEIFNTLDRTDTGRPD